MHVESGSKCGYVRRGASLAFQFLSHLKWRSGAKVVSGLSGFGMNYGVGEGRRGDV
jgi:hypothetical protein